MLTSSVRIGGGGGCTERDSQLNVYCGRRHNECACGECSSGICGPDEGCPCRACRYIDITNPMDPHISTEIEAFQQSDNAKYKIEVLTPWKWRITLQNLQLQNPSLMSQPKSSFVINCLFPLEFPYKPPFMKFIVPNARFIHGDHMVIGEEVPEIWPQSYLMQSRETNINGTYALVFSITSTLEHVIELLEEPVGRVNFHHARRYVFDQGELPKCWAYALCSTLCCAREGSFSEKSYKVIFKSEEDKLIQEVINDYATLIPGGANPIQFAHVLYLQCQRINQRWRIQVRYNDLGWMMDNVLLGNLSPMAVLFFLTDEEWARFYQHFQYTPNAILMDTFLGTMSSSASQTVSGHAVVLVGYERYADRAGGCFVFRNSWSTVWGEQGYFRADCNCFRDVIAYRIWQFVKDVNTPIIDSNFDIPSLPPLTASATRRNDEITQALITATASISISASLVTSTVDTGLQRILQCTQYRDTPDFFVKQYYIKKEEMKRKECQPKLSVLDLHLRYYARQRVLENAIINECQLELTRLKLHNSPQEERNVIMNNVYHLVLQLKNALDHNRIQSNNFHETNEGERTSPLTNLLGLTAGGAATRNTNVFPTHVPPPGQFRGETVQSVGDIVSKGNDACRVFNGKVVKNPATGELRGVGFIEYIDTDNDHIRLQATEETGKILKFVNGKSHALITSFTYDPATHRLTDHVGYNTPKGGIQTIRELSALLEAQQVPCTPSLPVFITVTIPNQPVVIRYALRPTVPLVVATKIHRAINRLQVDLPGVRWVEDTTRNNETACGKLLIQAEPGDGCWSYLGIRERGNVINLDPNWTANALEQGPPIGTILHELLHTLGVAHEHQRDDRHAYINVNQDNIDTNPNNYAAKANIHPFRYDYASIMHYPSGTGLEPSPTAWAKVGQRKCLSPLDKLFLNWLYPSPIQEGIYEPKMSTQTGLWYCGRRKVMKYHNFPGSMIHCDGFCGPNNGPNCPTCIIYGIGCGNSFPLQRTNKQGVVSSQGETGLFYCGRVMSRKVDSTHDGICGPNDGPNCAECYMYLVQPRNE